MTKLIWLVSLTIALYVAASHADDIQSVNPIASPNGMFALPPVAERIAPAVASQSDDDKSENTINSVVQPRLPPIGLLLPGFFKHLTFLNDMDKDAKVDASVGSNQALLNSADQQPQTDDNQNAQSVDDAPKRGILTILILKSSKLSSNGDIEEQQPLGGESVSQQDASSPVSDLFKSLLGMMPDRLGQLFGAGAEQKPSGADDQVEKKTQQLLGGGPNDPDRVRFRFDHDQDQDLEQQDDVNDWRKHLLFGGSPNDPDTLRLRHPDIDDAVQQQQQPANDETESANMPSIRYFGHGPMPLSIFSILKFNRDDEPSEKDDDMTMKMTMTMTLKP